ncbi:MAG: EAL domain-containing protein [Thiopseudomonas sp.]|nr:EAL domain-containing protein [Thiopseudomonas sp.]
MAIERKAVRLLILEESQNEAERIVSLFRNAGMPTRVHRVSDPEALAEALGNVWDLCIASYECENLQPLAALRMLQKAERDLPFIQIVAENDPCLVVEALQQGAQDAIAKEEDELLILVARRELASLAERRARRTAEIALQEAEKRCQLLLDSSMDAIAYVHDGMHIYANRAYVKLFGYSIADDFEGLPMTDLIAAKDQAAFKEFLRSYRSETDSADFQCSGINTEGESFEARLNFSPATYDGEPCVQVVIRTESDNAELEEKLKAISNLDSVTGLNNRRRFLELLDNATEKSINNGENASLAYIRLDDYNRHAAELGMAGIDSLLASMADMLSQSLGEDTLLARLADDVFCALKPATTPEQHKPALEALLKNVENKLFEVDGRTAQTTLSIGVACINEKTTKAVEVLDRARRSCEEQGKSNHLHIHNPIDDLAASASRGDQVAMVKHALETNSFRLLFQPIISLRGDSEELYEVLVRLLDPQGEEVAPNDFISAAISAGLAEKLDRWVLINAIKMLAQHRAKGHKTCLFIHLTSASLQDASLLPWLTMALKAAKLPPGSLVFQIRETDAVTYLKQVKALVEGLHALQCKAALGQFGCTVNPFNTLKHVNVDFVKIDGSFTSELHDQEQQENLKSMLSNLHGQSKLSIVPFVESASVLSVLWQAGVNYIQGHYLQGPTTAMDYDFSAND